jgi:hypothetical protein
MRAKHPLSYHPTLSERSWELHNRESHNWATDKKFGDQPTAVRQTKAMTSL